MIHLRTDAYETVKARHLGDIGIELLLRLDDAQRVIGINTIDRLSNLKHTGDTCRGSSIVNGDAVGTVVELLDFVGVVGKVGSHGHLPVFVLEHVCAHGKLKTLVAHLAHVAQH